MDWKKISKKLLFPPLWLTAVLAIVSAVLLTVVFVKGWELTALAHFTYGLSAYALCVLTALCVKILPGKIRRIRQRIQSIPFVIRCQEKPGLKTRSSMYVSLYCNLLYVLVNLFSLALNRSRWFAILAGYYLILAFLWALLAGFVRSNPVGSKPIREWQRARTCACILLLINLSLTGAVLMILYQSKGYQYPGILIYVMALHTFYSVIHAAVDIIKNRALESPILSTARIITLSAALVSVLNLETAMFAQFGQEMAQEHQRIFIILTGAGVSIAVVVLSVWLILRANKCLRKI